MNGRIGNDLCFLGEDVRRSVMDFIMKRCHKCVTVQAVISVLGIYSKIVPNMWNSVNSGGIRKIWVLTNATVLAQFWNVRNWVQRDGPWTLVKIRRVKQLDNLTNNCRSIVCISLSKSCKITFKISNSTSKTARTIPWQQHP